MNSFQTGKLTNLRCVQEDFSSLVDTKHDVGMVFHDISSEFDKMNHRLLLAKPEAFSISPAIRRWVTSFFGNPFMRVLIEVFSPV